MVEGSMTGVPTSDSRETSGSRFASCQSLKHIQHLMEQKSRFLLFSGLGIMQAVKGTDESSVMPLIGKFGHVQGQRQKTGNAHELVCRSGD